MNLLSVPEAAERKGISRQALLDAVKRNDISGSKVGRNWVVYADGKFEQWEPAAYRKENGLKREADRHGELD
jgi:hypothetical protein